jgi:hypothetical protein
VASVASVATASESPAVEKTEADVTELLYAQAKSNPELLLAIAAKAVQIKILECKNEIERIKEKRDVRIVQARIAHKEAEIAFIAETAKAPVPRLTELPDEGWRAVQLQEWRDKHPVNTFEHGGPRGALDMAANIVDLENALTTIVPRFEKMQAQLVELQAADEAFDRTAEKRAHETAMRLEKERLERLAERAREVQKDADVLNEARSLGLV